MRRAPGRPLVGRDESPRILLYAHNGAGYGHIGRIGTLAAYIKEELPHAAVACVSGCRYGANFIPDGADYIKLPAYTNVPFRGGDIVRRPALDVPWDDFLLLRRSLLHVLLQAYRPHVFLADTVPEGSFSELPDLIARRRGRVNVLLSPGVLDGHERVRASMHEGGMLELIRRSYDYVISVMDRKVFDSVKEYGLEALSDRMVHCGYILRRAPGRRGGRPRTSRQKRVVVAVGGGGGGVAFPFLKTVIAGLRRVSVPARYQVYAGSYISESQFRRVKELAPRGAVVERFTNDMVGALARSDLFVGRGGYSQLAEVVRARVPSLIVPWENFEQEQLLHTRRLHAIGAVSAYLTSAEATPEAVARAVTRLLREGGRPRDLGLDFDGGRQAARHIRRLLERGVP